MRGRSANAALEIMTDRDEHVLQVATDRFERRLAIWGLGDLKALVRKSFSYNTSQRFLIIDEE